MPSPWSRTVTPRESTVTSTGPPCPACRAALSSRLLIARVSRSALPRTNDGGEVLGELDLRRVAARAVQRLLGQPVQAELLDVRRRRVAARHLDQIGDEGAELLALLDHVGEQPVAVLLIELGA